MATSVCEKRGNFFELLQPPRPGSPEEQLEREIREWASKVRGKDGRVPGRQFYEIAEGVRHPFRVITRRVQEADEVHVPAEDLLELKELFARYIEARLQRRQGRRRGSEHVA